jgi:hypothetical protein
LDGSGIEFVAAGEAKILQILASPAATNSLTIFYDGPVKINAAQPVQRIILLQPVNAP